ncbi:hypothetical protein KAI12_00465 [Candidatus Bathyarchaeota archaeon]|nr:hypothetical protein [Candidatus Bathyarchaeota archaeon]
MKKIFKPKLLLALLAAAVFMAALALYLFYTLDLIVHGDLYNFGLHFNSNWGVQYWNISFNLQVSIAITIILFLTSAIAILIHNKHPLPSWLIGALPIVAAVSTLISIYLFNSLDWIVHHTLYDYGLQFSNLWANSYWAYARSIRVLFGIAGLLSLSTGLLVFTGKKITSNRRIQKLDLTKKTEQFRVPGFYPIKQEHQILSWAHAELEKMKEKETK